MSNVRENPSLNERINDFVQKNRKPIFVSLGLIILLLVGFVATISILDVVRKKAISEVEELSRRYDPLRFAEESESRTADIDALLGDLTSLAKRTSGYAGARAWAAIADIQGNRKAWAEVESAWINAGKASAKTYLGPIAWYNAGVAAEEQGKTAEAIEHYTQSLSLSAVFPAAPRVQFSIGRLQEALSDDAAAIEAYRAVISGWSYDTVWPNLARSRIIALEARAGYTASTE
ncbi:MAG: tetratricopeptide repeat protein [Treponema sp.]|jgi:tetratricopeptide (TPR) repeat protein|nr:tetratricopeptide repeat protein [Treponema sp.]